MISFSRLVSELIHEEEDVVDLVYRAARDVRFERAGAKAVKGAEAAKQKVHRCLDLTPSGEPGGSVCGHGDHRSPRPEDVTCGNCNSSSFAARVLRLGSECTTCLDNGFVRRYDYSQRAYVTEECSAC